MARRKNPRLDPVLKEWVEEVRRRYRPERIILFGSRANGEFWPSSDYDLVVVSKKFHGMHWWKRIDALFKLWSASADADILPYTPEEFEVKSHQRGIVEEAAETGLTIFP